jgi:cytochrome P450
MTNNAPVYWDPYRPDINLDPYPIYTRLREEAPLYYNPDYDFYTLSRFSDVDKMLVDKETFISGRTNILEFIKQEIQVPNGMFIWEDQPRHTAHRNVVARVFTPKRMNEIEGKIRAYCARCLEEKADSDRFDFIADLGFKLPAGVIGWLIGIPEVDRDAVRTRIDDSLRTETGKPMEAEIAISDGTDFAEYIEWRVNNPSDDLMTELLNVEFQDETGITRKLTRDEILIFVAMIAGAGNETTSRLIGWTGKILGDHPDQRREIAKNPELINQTIEEILRFEPPGPLAARYVARDIELHGQLVREGSIMMGLIGSANRDEQRFPGADRFDIHRQGAPHITFGRGIHSCIGSALARIEGRVALEETLKRFPDWTVDYANAEMSSSSTTRGWEKLPVFIE